MMLINPKILSCIGVLVFVQLANAQIQQTIFDINALPDDIKNNKAKIVEYEQRRFRQYENNTLMLDYLNGDEIDKHIDAKLSIAYLLTDPKKAEYESEVKSDWNLAFSATVEFDFYMGTRDSGPVVGRRYNPGLQYYYSRNILDGWRELRLSLEHESNGQSTETRETLAKLTSDFYDRYESESGFDANKARELAEETISMGNNFVSIGGVYRLNNDELNDTDCSEEFNCFDLHIKLRDNSFITDENSGNFRSMEAREQNLSEYQGTSISYFNRFSVADKHDFALELTYITGQINGGKLGENNSFKANLYYNWHIDSKDLTIPLIASCHTGYVHDLYNFAEKKSECTFGFHFIY